MFGACPVDGFTVRRLVTPDSGLVDEMKAILHLAICESVHFEVLKKIIFVEYSSVEL